MKGLTYDAGALLAAEARDMAVWALHSVALEIQLVPTVPAPVLAQAWRGSRGRSANMARFLSGCWVEPLDEPLARTAGVLLGLSRTSDVVDAVVVASALTRADLVVTSVPDDLHHLASSAGRSLHLRRV